jgi:hypothetical protein
LNQGSEGEAFPKTTRAQEVLEVIDRYPTLQSVFEKYDERAGECFCCSALFQSIEEVAIKYSIDLDALLEDLNGGAG